MDSIDERIWALVTSNLSGEASPEEKRELRRWLVQDSKHQEFFNDIEASWKTEPVHSVDASFLFNHESGLRKLRYKLEKENSIQNKKRFEKRNPATIYTFKIAASILICIVSVALYVSFHSNEHGVSVVNYTTSDSEQRIITLPDGSTVRLNRNSEIEFEDNVENLARSIRLKGEAFFEVIRNEERRLVIHAGNAVVEVLGTSFNVKEGDEVTVAVQKGLVSFRHRSRKVESAALLAPGQLGYLPKGSSEVNVEQTNVENYLSWMNGYLRFDSMPFDQVLAQLEHIYGVDHDFEDPSIGSLKLTAYTERMHMEEVLKTIALALDLTYEKQEYAIKWSKARGQK